MPRTPWGRPARDGFEDAGGGDGRQDQDDGEDGPEAERLGHQAADVAVRAADASVDGGDDAHGRAEDAGLQVFAEHDVGEREDGAGDALQEPAGDEERQGGGGDAEDGARAHDAEDQEQGGAASDEVAPASDDGPGDGAGEEEHGLDGGGAVGAWPKEAAICGSAGVTMLALSWKDSTPSSRVEISRAARRPPSPARSSPAWFRRRLAAKWRLLLGCSHQTPLFLQGGPALGCELLYNHV